MDNVSAFVLTALIAWTLFLLVLMFVVQMAIAGYWLWGLLAG